MVDIESRSGCVEATPVEGSDDAFHSEPSALKPNSKRAKYKSAKCAALSLIVAAILACVAAVIVVVGRRPKANSPSGTEPIALNTSAEIVDIQGDTNDAIKNSSEGTVRPSITEDDSNGERYIPGTNVSTAGDSFEINEDAKKDYTAACLAGLAAADFSMMRTDLFSLWFNKSSTMHIAETGVYRGPDGIAEYVNFLFSPYFEEFLRPEPFKYVPVKLAKDECVIMATGWNRVTINASLGKEGCIEFISAFKLHYTVKESFSIHRTDVFFPKSAIQAIFADFLDTTNARDYICDTMQHNCEETFAFNNLTKESCQAEYDALPGITEGSYIDGNTKSCRLLHAPFAAENSDHCAHLSFVPKADPKGRIKCQKSNEVQVEELFSPSEIREMKDIADKKGFPQDTMFAKCKV